MSRLKELTTVYLTALANKNVDAVVDFFTDDVSLIGPAGPADGKTAARTAIQNLVTPVGGISITQTNTYQEDSTVITELTVTTDDGDDNTNTVYFVNILTFTGEKISSNKLFTL